MKIFTVGLIIRQQNIGERDRLVTALTEQLGVVRCFVRGARDIKSPKCAATELLCYSKLTLHKSRDSYIIGDAKPLKIFGGLRGDLGRMYTAQYFCELAGTLCPKEQEAGVQLRLILNALYLISENKRPISLVKPCVELRLMCEAGYMPDLTMCRECGEYEKETVYFLPKVGQLICRDCCERLALGEHKIALNRTSLTALRHCCYADGEKLFSFSVPEDDLRALNFCAEEYVRFITERNYKTLQFLKTII